MPHFIARFVTILMLTGSLWLFEKFHGRISLNLVLLLMLVNFVNGFRLELKYISLTESIRSNLTDPLGFQLLVQLLLNLKWSWDKLVIAAKEFLKLPKLHMLLKLKSPSLPRNLALGTFGKLLRVFSTKVNLLYVLYSTDKGSCLLHLIKQIIC